MSWSLLLEAPIGLGPVVVFLIVLQRLDSFRLVSLYTIGVTIAAGGILAGVSYLLNGIVIDVLNLDIEAYTRYVSPVIEETPTTPKDDAGGTLYKFDVPVGAE